MFSIFKKKKPKLSEIIPDGFVDIHSHILPGIDDGPSDVNESINLIKSMEKLGFKKIIGTPHTYPGLYDNTNYSIEKSFKKLSSAYKNNIQLNFASEYLITDSIITKAKNKDLLTIKKNYVLIEMSFISAPINLHDIIFKLQLYGYKPILAHPERYHFMFGNFENFKKLRRIGCEFQLNLFSTVNFYGNDVAKMSEKLLKNDMIDYVGSDIHSYNQINLFDKNLVIESLSKLEESIERNNILI